MSCMQEHSRSFRKVPEPSGTFLVCVVCKNIPEASGTFRNILSGATWKLYLWNELYCALYGLSCIIFTAFRNVTTFPQRRFRKVPEPSGRFRNLLSLCCMQEHSRSFRKVPEPSGTFLVGHLEVVFMEWVVLRVIRVELYYFYCIS